MHLKLPVLHCAIAALSRRCIQGSLDQTMLQYQMLVGIIQPSRIDGTQYAAVCLFAAQCAHADPPMNAAHSCRSRTCSVLIVAACMADSFVHAVMPSRNSPLRSGLGQERHLTGSGL